MRSVLNEANVFDVMNDVLTKINKYTGRTENGKNKNAHYIGGSISAYAKNLTMTFPVLVDDGLSVETAQIISKANEKNITSMLEMLFASMSMNMKNGQSGADVIGTFHKNINTNPNVDDYIDYVNNIVNNESTEISSAEMREVISEMCSYLRSNHKRFPVSSFKETSLNDYMCKDGYNGTMVYEHKFVPVNEAPNRYYDPYYDDYSIDQSERKFTYQRERDREKDERDREKDERDREKDERDSRHRHQLDNIQFSNQLNQKRILDSDFKKANELQPTMMIVNFNVVENNGEAIVVTDRKSFVAGVKCRMIATSPLDIVERLLSANKQAISFKDLIRATTGEIKFVNDFILANSQQKLDAKNDNKKGEAAQVWSTLKKRSLNNNVRKITKNKNDATAITTLIVSQDTVNYMISSNKFDISLPKNAKLIMDAYNLLCLVIADESNEVAKFLYDGNNEFEMLAFSVLSKEAQDRNYRKEVNLLTGR